MIKYLASGCKKIFVKVFFVLKNKTIFDIYSIGITIFE